MGFDVVNCPFIIFSVLTNYLGVHPPWEESIIIGDMDPKKRRVEYIVYSTSLQMWWQFELKRGVAIVSKYLVRAWKGQSPRSWLWEFG